MGMINIRCFIVPELPMREWEKYHRELEPFGSVNSHDLNAIAIRLDRCLALPLFMRCKCAKTFHEIVKREEPPSFKLSCQAEKLLDVRRMLHAIHQTGY